MNIVLCPTQILFFIIEYCAMSHTNSIFYYSCERLGVYYINSYKCLWCWVIKIRAAPKNLFGLHPHRIGPQFQIISTCFFLKKKQNKLCTVHIFMVSIYDLSIFYSVTIIHSYFLWAIICTLVILLFDIYKHIFKLRPNHIKFIKCSIYKLQDS